MRYKVVSFVFSWLLFFFGPPLPPRSICSFAQLLFWFFAWAFIKSTLMILFCASAYVYNMRFPPPMPLFVSLFFFNYFGSPWCYSNGKFLLFDIKVIQEVSKWKVMAIQSAVVAQRRNIFFASEWKITERPLWLWILLLVFLSALQASSQFCYFCEKSIRSEKFQSDFQCKKAQFFNVVSPQLDMCGRYVCKYNQALKKHFVHIIKRNGASHV